MTLHEFFTRLVPATGLAFIVALSFAQAQREPDYQPSVGQEGKDVVWVPTSQALVDKMLDMAKLTPNDFHMDLGSGDGRTVITAAKRGARSLGIEYNPDMVELAKRNAAKEGVADKATFKKADLFETDFSEANVLTLFLLPNINVRLRPKILEMKPGTRVVSNSFDMGDWTPDERVTVTEGCTNYCNALFWIVPANVQGKWKLPNGELAIGAEVSEPHGHGEDRQRLRADQRRQDDRRSDRVLGRRHQLHRPGERQHHRRHQQVGVRREQVDRNPRGLAVCRESLSVIPGPAEGRSPESMSPSVLNWIPGSRCRAPRNDHRCATVGIPPPPLCCGRG